MNRLGAELALAEVVPSSGNDVQLTADTADCPVLLHWYIGSKQMMKRRAYLVKKSLKLIRGRYGGSATTSAG